ncbi:hypothetical protein ABT300_28740 [Streptomyces sp. NPDC001027]|uniref:hypothetical protein n=1 Tax=Streptomyces sp. NPDC001027 TaxID=3154771 RepID=UPI00331F22EB
MASRSTTGLAAAGDAAGSRGQAGRAGRAVDFSAGARVAAPESAGTVAAGAWREGSFRGGALAARPSGPEWAIDAVRR